MYFFKKSYHHFYLVWVLVLFFASCGGNKPKKPDVSGWTEPVTTHRLDMALFGYNGFDFDSLNRALSAQYAGFYDDFVSEILALGSPDNPMIDISMMRFLGNENWQTVQRDIEQKFGDLDKINNDFTKAFAFYKYYFDTQNQPEIIYYNSGFNYANHLKNNYLGVGLEFYLGAENEIIKLLSTDEFPNYLKQKMDEKFLLANTMEFWLLMHHYEEPAIDDFLHQIVNYGKMKYLLKLILPDLSDAEIMLYSAEELKWVEKNEGNIWKKFVEDELIYATEPTKVMKMLGDGPFTPGLPKESPGRVAIWLGYKIVNDFMAKNPELTIHELLAEQDARKILAFYKPKK
jgi:hypothetical protein